MPPSIKGKNPVSKAIPQLINKIYALYISAAARGNDLAGSIRNRPFSVPVPVPNPPASLPPLPLPASETPAASGSGMTFSPPASDILLPAVLCPYAKGCSLPTPKGRRFPERPFSPHHPPRLHPAVYPLRLATPFWCQCRSAASCHGYCPPAAAAQNDSPYSPFAADGRHSLAAYHGSLYLSDGSFSLSI